MLTGASRRPCLFRAPRPEHHFSIPLHVFHHWWCLWRQYLRNPHQHQFKKITVLFTKLHYFCLNCWAKICLSFPLWKRSPCKLTWFQLIDFTLHGLSFLKLKSFCMGCSSDSLLYIYRFHPGASLWYWTSLCNLPMSLLKAKTLFLVAVALTCQVGAFCTLTAHDPTSANARILQYSGYNTPSKYAVSFTFCPRIILPALFLSPLLTNRDKALHTLFGGRALTFLGVFWT